MTKEYVVIPDIHGKYDLLKMALDWVYSEYTEPTKIIFLGDYIDRGPENVKVLDTVMNPPDGWEFITLLGNHEEMFRNEQVYHPPSAFEIMNSEKGHKFYIEWMKTLPIFHWQDNNVFAHAYYDPRLLPTQQNIMDVVWQRYDDHMNWQADLPIEKQKFHLTHGHTPRQNGPIISPKRLNLDTGAVFTNRLVIAIFEYGKLGPQQFKEFEV